MSRAVIAAALFAAISIAGCGSGSTKTVTVTGSSSATVASSSTTAPSSSTASTTTSTTTSATSASSTSGAVLHLAAFRSPSGNIGCEMVAGFARCDIAQRSWKPPPKPSSCPLDYGQGLGVGRSGNGYLVCAGDTALNPHGTPLPYGSSSRVAPMTCASASNGVTCTNTATRHGFFISKQSYRVF